ncbi:hypothetical protein C477_09104 [Haloterrigena salina JCM 13891]|uniref:Methyltransferase FkbM domain-containing protein n=1 Tax=Haloterrigena salina JCM 13891 TaxID=1227488 RepID=M0C9W6_9EURY|nr:FkbM family methyltransferase [Haloterrigena salina]ELZ19147.1 hypothetical protein C477_09104 [Haloterrigena salina JCM 13891]
MTSLLGRARNALRKGGLSYVIREAIPHLHKHYLRDHLPRTKTKLNGVIVKRNRIFDGLVPWEVNRPDPENYESAIVSRLKSGVTTGDTVVIVGGGWGVSTVVAAQAVGESGSVHTFEASPEYAEYTRETVRLNDVANRCTVTTAVVAKAVSTQGDAESEVVLSPAELPDCEVLELDCEGAEIEILQELQSQPRVIIVETHGVFGAPTEAVAEALESMSYEIVSTEIADRGLAEMHEAQDVRVLTARDETQ